MDRGLFKFIERCLQPDPGHRVTAQDLVDSDFLRGLPDSLAGTLSGESEKVRRLVQWDCEEGAAQRRAASLQALADALLSEGGDVSAALMTAVGDTTGGPGCTVAPLQWRVPLDGADRPASRQVLRRDSMDGRPGAAPSSGRFGRPPRTWELLDGRSSTDPPREPLRNSPSERQPERQESWSGTLATDAAAGSRQPLRRREYHSGALPADPVGSNRGPRGKGSEGGVTAAGFGSGRHSWSGTGAGGAQEDPTPSPPVSASMARLLAGAKVYGVPAAVSVALRWQVGVWLRGAPLTARMDVTDIPPGTAVAPHSCIFIPNAGS